MGAVEYKGSRDVRLQDGGFFTNYLYAYRGYDFEVNGILGGVSIRHAGEYVNTEAAGRWDSSRDVLDRATARVDRLITLAAAAA